MTTLATEITARKEREIKRRRALGMVLTGEGYKFKRELEAETAAHAEELEGLLRTLNLK
jgi:hypothetical protein